MKTTLLIAQISDTHIKPEGRLAYERIDTAWHLGRCVEHLLALDPRPDVVLATGDLVDAGLAEEYRRLARLLAPLPMPVYLIPGNHDARDPLREVFAHHRYLPRSGFLQYAVDEYPLRLIWLDARLAEAPSQPTLIFMHHPPFRTGIDRMDRQGLANAEAMGKVIAQYPQIEAIVCGHLHRPIHTRWHGTVVTTAPSPAHQVALDLDKGDKLGWVMEPPACLLHVWRAGAGLVTHTSYVGEFSGPYPFYKAGKLID